MGKTLISPISFLLSSSPSVLLVMRIGGAMLFRGQGKTPQEGRQRKGNRACYCSLGYSSGTTVHGAFSLNLVKIISS
jgi:hypothetical protein